jgi:hypothetical protein
LHRIREIAFDLIQDIFAASTQEDSASFGLFALDEISEISTRGERGDRSETRRERERGEGEKEGEESGVVMGTSNLFRRTKVMSNYGWTNHIIFQRQRETDTEGRGGGGRRELTRHRSS